MDRYLKIPFLGSLFYEFKHPVRLTELRLAAHLDRAAATLARVDRSAFFARFTYHRLDQDDSQAPQPAAAITYFYEPFLEAFDPDLRKELGVWYTPPEIVRYQVRRVDRLLREHLGCERGFADPRVVVLDPCCGTAAYLIEVVQCIANDVRARGDDALLAAELLEAVSTRVIGFEILTAPFVVAQLQLYHLLTDLGATLGSGKRPAVFLTNALSGWGGPEQIKVNFPELQTEHDLARQVKHQARVIVVLGNPPYNRFTGTAVDEEADLVAHYKGIVRREKKGKDGKTVLVQEGESLLYARWGIRKQLLDDLYIRFFRLAEKRIGEHAEYGVVSFISNSSYLTGRSHPLMRESLLKNFHEVWIDNLHGNRLASERTPWGESCETLFSFAGAVGIKVGTCISTFLKQSRPATLPNATLVHHRDFWGRASDKRRGLLESLNMHAWDTARRTQAASEPSGPREYETISPSQATRWMFAPRDSNVGFEAWPALDELFPKSFQGVNPNRGLDGSVVDVSRARLAERMKHYFSAESFADVTRRCAEIAERRARYEPEQVWKVVRKVGFDDSHIKPYLLFPLDSRWLYYETARHFLNEPRRELGENLEKNEFLVTVPQPRRVSETRPLLVRMLFDLHLHDRGSVGFPRETRDGGLLDRVANLRLEAWNTFRSTWGIAPESLGHREACRLVSELFRFTLAILHAPQYQADHQDALGQDWAHVPIPKDKSLFDALVALGDKIGIALDPTASVDRVLREVLGKGANSLGVLRAHGGGQVSERDLAVTTVYFGAAPGRWVERAFATDELTHPAWGSTTGDLYINKDVYFRNVPGGVWRFELGGYPVLKKWLGYRQATRRNGLPLSLEERSYFRSMIQRIAALMVLSAQANAVYEQAAASAFTAEELGIRK